jgi:undecaprenyl-diphosphatase
MHDLITALILGIVEGVTEFLPISSTGHLLITEKLASQWAPHQSDLFNIVIQSGAVLAVLPLFKDRLRKMVFGWKDAATRDFIIKIFAAFFITGVGGFILEKHHFKLPEELRPIAFALFIGGVLFVLIEKWIKNKPVSENLTWTVAIAIGLAQLLAAVFPGASRSGATILFALLLGVSRPAATEFSFLVGIPTMLAAGGYKIFKELHHHAGTVRDQTAAVASHVNNLQQSATGTASENWTLLLLTTIISAIVSFIAVKWLLRYVQSHTFTGFGWYRIGVGGALIIACIFGGLK